MIVTLSVLTLFYFFHTTIPSSLFSDSSSAIGALTPARRERTCFTALAALRTRFSAFRIRKLSLFLVPPFVQFFLLRVQYRCDARWVFVVQRLERSERKLSVDLEKEVLRIRGGPEKRSVEKRISK